MVMGMSALALAWQVNQHYYNNTGQTAHDLTKIIPGNYNITEAMLNQPFANYEVVHINGYTIIHWYNGQVAPGERGHACFSTDALHRPPVIVSLWTDVNGNFIGIAGPVVGTYPWLDVADGHIKLEIGNDMAAWNGTSYPIQVGDGPGAPRGPINLSQVYYAFSEIGRPLEDLDSTLFDSPDLAWHQLNDVGLAYQDSVQIDIGRPRGAYVLFRFDLDGADGQSYYVIQRYLGKGWKVPSLTEWGLFILVLLLIASGIVVIRNRRRGFVH